MEQGDCNYELPSKFEEEWKVKQTKQDNELIEWLDEFMQSEEYVEQMKRKSRGVKVILPKIDNHVDTHVEIYKSPKVQSKLIALEEKLQTSFEKLHIDNTIANQNHGIAIIRQKIMDCKIRYNQNIFKGKVQAMGDHKKVRNILKKDYHIGLPASEELSPVIIDKILQRRLVKRNKAKNATSNKICIVTKLVGELNRANKIKRNLNKKYKYKIKKRAISSTDMNTFAISTQEESSGLNVTAETEEIASDIIETDENVKKEKTKKQKVVKNAKTKDITSKTNKKSKKVSKKSKQSNKTSKNSKKSKKSAKKPEEENLIPSNIPNVNPRKKIVPEYMLNQLLEDFTKLYEYLKEKENYELEAHLGEKLLLPVDQGFFSKPNKIIFKDYQPGKIYKKIISIVNGNRSTKKIRFERIIWNSDIEEDLLLDIESFGICKVLPGMGFKICLRFAPEVLNKTTDGKIIFLTYKLNSQRKQQYILNVVCVPMCAAVSISPTVISFDELPIWRARKLMKQGKNYKTITIGNAGMKECKVVITKMFNIQTIEQEWKKIISIIRIDDTTTEKPPMSSSNLEDRWAADPFPRDLVQQCVENVFNVFKFERNVFSVEAKTSKTIKCWFKDIDEAGYQVESYTFSIYERFLDGNLYCIGTQDVIVNSETTAHFLTPSAEMIDFEVCVYGSAYQLDFDVTNPCKLAHHVQICFPARMKSYLQSNIGVATIQPNQTLKIFIKFLPYEGILEDNKFYDNELCLLEFPVYVTVQTRGYEDTPPLKIDAFAVVTEAKGVVLTPVGTNLNDTEQIIHFFMNFGNCTTMETIYTELQVQNLSLVPQQFGFLNLPEYVTLEPNFGFGKLMPMQKAKMRILLSPSKNDIITPDGQIQCQLQLSTIKQCGALKKKFGTINLVKKLKQMEEYVCRSRGSSNAKLKQDVNDLREALKRHSMNIEINHSNSSVQRLLQVLGSNEQLVNVIKYDMEEEKAVPMHAVDDSETTTPNHILNVKANVIDVAVDFSHQHIMFPDTPCGSYSCMHIDLIARKLSHIKYVATFEIIGDSDDIEVQPTYGRVKHNSKKAICLIAKPKIPLSVIQERARALKVAKFLETQAQKELDKIKSKNVEDKSKKKEKGASGDHAKTTKNKPKSNKKSETNQDNVSIGFGDYYQAEIDVWRTMEPYFIEKVFTCRITYKNLQGMLIDRPQEEIFFKTTCQVVQPAFVHDQNYQVIDFGMVAIGMSTTKVIKFQNIQRKNITIDVTPTNPAGPYSSAAKTDNTIPSEFIYSYPIKFTPIEEQREMEFLNFSSGSTSYPFIIRGIGVKANITFDPNFIVCRISAASGGFADCSFEIKNNCAAHLQITLQKLCELEGVLLEPHQVETFNKKNANKAKTNKTNPKHAKFSTELYPDEIYSLEHSFKVRSSADMFHALNNTGLENTYAIEPQGKCAVKVRFGYLPKSTNTDDTNMKGTKKHAKPNTKKGSQSKSFKADKNMVYLAKYNIFLGRITYLKDIIVIGTFN